MDNVLSEWLGKQKVPQYHVAGEHTHEHAHKSNLFPSHFLDPSIIETEKYAHVTFFFNGGTEKEFELEDRKMVPSPKVATYDLQPEMNSKEVGEEVAKGLATGKYPFVMCNFAPPDMVGHTGIYEKAVLAVEATGEECPFVD